MTSAEIVDKISKHITADRQRAKEKKSKTIICVVDPILQITQYQMDK